MKLLRSVCRVGAAAIALAVLVLFFFNLAQIVADGGKVLVSGAQLAFGGSVALAGKSYALYKSLYFFFAMLLAAATLVFAVLSFKFKGSPVAAMVFAALTAIDGIALVSVSHPALRVDYRPLPGVQDVHYTGLFWAAMALILLAFLATVAAFLVADYVQAMESNGQKLPIFGRIRRFFREYSAEIKKVVWPSKEKTKKDTISVVVMCLIAGAFIWLLDWGLSALLKLIFHL